MTRAGTAGAAATVAWALLIVAGCGPDVVVREAAFKKAAPRTVAILPFTLAAGAGAGGRAELKTAALREAFHRRFASLHYLHLESAETDKLLRRKGLLDAKRLAAATPAELGRVLGVDAIVRGEVLSLANLTGGVVYRQSIAARLTLADARTGETLVAVEHTEADTGGVLVGSGQLVDAIRDTLDNSSDLGFVRLAERFAGSVVRAFPPPPEPVEVVAPRIDAADVRASYGRTLVAGDEVEVTLAATPGGAAFFDIGRDQAEIPLLEEAPGRYRGVYRVAHGDRGAGPVSVHVSDRFGVTARSVVRRDPELTVDARPPAAPERLAVAAAPGAVEGGGVRIEWATGGGGSKASAWRVFAIDRRGAPSLVAELPGGETRARVPVAAGVALLAVAGVDERGALGPLAFVEVKPTAPVQAQGGTSRMIASGRRSMILGLGLWLGLGGAGCGTAQHRRAEGFDPRVPLRVAVLPFVDRSSGDALVSKPLTAVVDLIPVLSDDELTKEHAATIFRVQFAGNLHRTALAPIDTHVVDSLLDHRRTDIAAAVDGDRGEAAKALGEVLGADAVVFGWVLEWDRSYYGLESAVRAGLRVEMRDTTTGGILFESEVRDSKYAGLTKVPVAYSPAGAIQSAIVEPLKGLRNTTFATLADDIARASIAGLAPPAEERAAAPAPRIYFVAHSGSAPLRPGDALVVVAIADPGLRATFEVDDDHPPVPMTEGAPGSYRGTLEISPAHAFRGETLRVRAVSPALAASSMTVARPPIVVAGIASAR